MSNSCNHNTANHHDEYKATKIDYLEIDEHPSDNKIMQRIEHCVVNYISNDSYSFKKFNLSRDHAVWDEQGRLRINTEANYLSKVSIETSQNHALLWTLISFFYQRFQKGIKHQMKIRELYYHFKHLKILNSINDVSRAIFSLVMLE